MSPDTAIKMLLAQREVYLRKGADALVAEVEARLAAFGHRPAAPAAPAAPRAAEPQVAEAVVETASVEPQTERAARKRPAKRSA